MVSRSISGTQKDVDAKSDSAWCVAMAADGLQLSAFRVSKDELGRGWEWHTNSMRPPITLVKTFQIQKTRNENIFRPIGRAASSAGWESGRSARALVLYSSAVRIHKSDAGIARRPRIAG